MITSLLLLSALVLVIMWAWPTGRRAAASGSTAAGRGGRRGRERAPQRGDGAGRPLLPLLQGEAVFAEWSGPRQVALDCLLSPGAATGGAQAPSEPVHVRVHGAALGWTGGSLADLPVRWLQDDRRVFLNVVARGQGRLIAKVTDGRSCALLEVDEVVAAAVADSGTSS